jgi:hypothetical protein
MFFKLKNNQRKNLLYNRFIINRIDIFLNSYILLKIYLIIKLFDIIQLISLLYKVDL